MWSTELSNEEDKPPSKDQPGITNDFLPLLLDADNNDDNNGYAPQPRKIKMMESLWKLLINLTHYTMVQSVEENTQCAE